MRVDLKNNLFVLGLRAAFYARPNATAGSPESEQLEQQATFTAEAIEKLIDEKIRELVNSAEVIDGKIWDGS